MLQLYVNMKEYTLVILLHEQALTLIAMHYTKDTWHWRSKVTEDCSSLSASSSLQSNNQRLHVGWIAPLQRSSVHSVLHQ